MGVNSNIKGFMETNATEFDDDVINSKGFTLVVFYRNGCHACKEWEPTLVTLAEKYSSYAKMVRAHIELNGDTVDPLRARFDITGEPHSILFHEGEIVTQITGNMNEEYFIRKINFDLSNFLSSKPSLNSPSHWTPRIPVAHHPV